jgi:hypothetical protein
MDIALRLLLTIFRNHKTYKFCYPIFYRIFNQIPISAEFVYCVVFDYDDDDDDDGG